MTTKKTSYLIAQATCEKDTCNKNFSVIISSIYTVVTKPVVEIGFSIERQLDIVKEGEIDDYIVAKCICGHSQRVYLKSNKNE